MLADLDAILASPRYLCLGFAGGRAQFCRMDREAYRESIFLDRRVKALGSEIFEVDVAALQQRATQRQVNESAWIFHIAHCGSTLLSRLLDQPGYSLGLREPPALRQLGIERGLGASKAALVERLELARFLSSRRFDVDEVAVIKANVPVNFILDQLTDITGEEPAIALYLDLPEYLCAILRTDNHRGWVERISTTFRSMIEASVGTPVGSTTAEKAAALWLAQMVIFEELLARNPRAAALNAADLFAEPLEFARRSTGHLGLQSVDPGQNAYLLDGYSKDPTKPFDSAARKARAAVDRDRLRPELDLATAWIDRAGKGNSPNFAFVRRL